MHKILSDYRHAVAEAFGVPFEIISPLLGYDKPEDDYLRGVAKAYPALFDDAEALIYTDTLLPYLNSNVMDTDEWDEVYFCYEWDALRTEQYRIAELSTGERLTAWVSYLAKDPEAWVAQSFEVIEIIRNEEGVSSSLPIQPNDERLHVGETYECMSVAEPLDFEEPEVSPWF